ncbi:MAG: hypothetical protein ABIP20_13420 [Chthoniobacteraceae bacterium]
MNPDDVQCSKFSDSTTLILVIVVIASLLIFFSVLLTIHPLPFRFHEFVGHQDPLPDYESNCQPEKENSGDKFHGLGSLPGSDSRRENAYSYAHPQTKNARHPDSDKEAVFVTDKEPQGNARKKANEGSDEERIIDLMKHGRRTMSYLTLQGLAVLDRQPRMKVFTG